MQKVEGQVVQGGRLADGGVCLGSTVKVWAFRACYGVSTILFRRNTCVPVSGEEERAVEGLMLPVRCH